MAKATRPAPGKATILADALDAALGQLAQAHARDRFFFPNGINLIELSFKPPSEFSLKIGGPPGAGAHAEAFEMDEDVCAAPDDEEGAVLEAPAAPVNTPLAVPTTGLYGYTSAAKRFGIAKVIAAVIAIGEKWNTLHPDAPIGVGNISKQGGGTLPPHASHKKGIDVDLRPMRKDKAQEPVTFQDSAYSRALTQELVNVVRANTVLPIDRIFFNDPNVSGVGPLAGHHNHLHVRFRV